LPFASVASLATRRDRELSFVSAATQESKGTTRITRATRREIAALLLMLMLMLLLLFLLVGLFVASQAIVGPSSV